MAFTDPVLPDGVRDGSRAPAADQRADEAFRNPSWFPYRLDYERNQALFTRTNRDALAAQPFLDPRWDRSRAASLTLPIEALADAPAPERAPGFIWHTAFCCSTLIADCLDEPGRCLSLKEPAALVDLASARREACEPSGDAVAVGLMRLLGRAAHPGARVLIKPSNDANTLMEALVQVSGAVLLLHSTLGRFLLAVTRGGEARRRFARDLLLKRALAPGARFGAREVALLSDLQASAVLWRIQMEEFAAAARIAGPARARFLDCDAFLENPAGVLSQLDGFFELGLGEARIGAVVRGPKLKRHAKAPGLAFDPAREREALGEVRRVHARDLEAAETWCVAEFGEFRL